MKDATACSPRRAASLLRSGAAQFCCRPDPTGRRVARFGYNGPMSSVKPRDIFLAKITRREAPRAATGSATSIVTMDLMDRVGAWFPQAHLDARQMADLAAAGHTLLGFDNVMPLFGGGRQEISLSFSSLLCSPASFREKMFSGRSPWLAADWCFPDKSRPGSPPRRQR